MARIDIAEFLGITIETVSRTLTKLRVQGLIDIEQITTLHLRKFERLVAIAVGRAGFNPSVCARS
jgi:Mn-dependent DtxR family transcriptional regulator